MPDAVSDFLAGIGLGLLEDTFAEHDIDEVTLFELDENDLKEMGVRMGPRRNSERSRRRGAEAGDGRARRADRHARRWRAPGPGGASSNDLRRRDRLRARGLRLESPSPPTTQ